MRTALLSFVVLALVGVAARADEGMWLFTNPPRKLLEDK